MIGFVLRLLLEIGWKLIFWWGVGIGFFVGFFGVVINLLYIGVLVDRMFLVVIEFIFVCFWWLVWFGIFGGDFFLGVLFFGVFCSLCFMELLFLYFFLCW